MGEKLKCRFFFYFYFNFGKDISSYNIKILLTEKLLFLGEEKVSSLFLYLHNGIDIFNVERYISHAVPMSGKMIGHFFVIRLVRRFEHKHYLRSQS